ncbi:hypothetical protein [Methanothermococcus thermolithotrophicus]|uniref:hypothetical protein n=1 Tax=Methanothermococcus thermolithotrophicus TaxID=2186 RepID=UPI000382BBA3|nr:hypothetical protein [Methanothermococcus thermolithotrophicus]
MLPIGRVARRMVKPRPHIRPRPPRRMTPPRPRRVPHSARAQIMRPLRPHITPPRMPHIPHIKAPRIPKIRAPKIRMPEVPHMRIPKLRTPKLRTGKGVNEPKVSKWDKLNAIVGGLGIAATGAELYMMSKWMGDSGDGAYEDTGYGEDYGYGDMGYGGGYGDMGYGGYSDAGYGSGYLDSAGDALGGAVSDYLPDSALDPSGDIENGTLQPTDDGGYVDENGNYYVPDPETGELINPNTGQPYIPKTTKYTLIGVVLVLFLVVGVVIHKKRKKG